MVDFAKRREELKAQAAQNAANPPAALKTDEDLDHALLTFGKYKGETPSEIAQTEEGAKWLVWAYDTVKNRPTCSETLARDCGWKPPLTKEQARAIRANAGKPTSNDQDDDIPF